MMLLSFCHLDGRTKGQWMKMVRLNRSGLRILRPCRLVIVHKALPDILLRFTYFFFHWGIDDVKTEW